MSGIQEAVGSSPSSFHHKSQGLVMNVASLFLWRTPSQRDILHVNRVCWPVCDSAQVARRVHLRQRCCRCAMLPPALTVVVIKFPANGRADSGTSGSASHMKTLEMLSPGTLALRSWTAEFCARQRAWPEEFGGKANEWTIFATNFLDTSPRHQLDRPSNAVGL